MYTRTDLVGVEARQGEGDGDGSSGGDGSDLYFSLKNISCLSHSRYRQARRCVLVRFATATGVFMRVYVLSFFLDGSS